MNVKLKYLREAVRRSNSNVDLRERFRRFEETVRVTGEIESRDLPFLLNTYSLIYKLNHPVSDNVTIESQESSVKSAYY